MRCVSYEELIDIAGSLHQPLDIRKDLIYRCMYPYHKFTVDEYKFVCKMIDDYRHPGNISIKMISKNYDAISLKKFYDMMITEFGYVSLAMIEKHSLLGIAYKSAILSSSKENKMKLVIPDTELVFSILKKLIIKFSYIGATIDDEVREKYM